MAITDKLLGNKALKTTLAVVAGLVISFSLTLICVLFIPSTFNSLLHKGLELLPKNKFIEYKVQTRDALGKQWLVESHNVESDKPVFLQLRETFPSRRNKDIFFADMFVVHDYPEPCFFTIFGQHIALDITWTVKGIRCRGAAECNDPNFIERCPPRRGRDK